MLRQVGDDSFEVAEPFTYDDGTITVHVPYRPGATTDLASIPFFMAWFVPVNGRHTPAALVHDTLLGDIFARVRSRAISVSEAGDLRADADDVFLTAMAATGVPLVRRTLMYAAVTMATRWKRSWSARSAMVLWTIASVLGSIALVAGVVLGSWWLAALAALAPIPAALLWGPRHWRCGVIAGYGSWMIGLPALGTAIGYGSYWLVEQAVRPLVARGAATNVSETSPPAPYR